MADPSPQAARAIPRERELRPKPIDEERMSGKMGPREKPASKQPASNPNRDGTTTRQNKDTAAAKRKMRVAWSSLLMAMNRSMTTRLEPRPIQKSETIHCALPSVPSRYRVANIGIHAEMLASTPP